MMFSNTYGLVNQECWDLLKSGSLPTDFFKNARLIYYLWTSINSNKNSNQTTGDILTKMNTGRLREKIWELYKNKLKRNEILNYLILLTGKVR